MSRALPSLACLFSVTLLPTIAFAQPSAATVPFEAADSGYVSLDQESFSGGVTLNGTYFDIRNQSGSGMGYTHGFTQLGAFTPYWLSEDSYIALNGRINIIGNGDVGFNTGLVGRRYVNDSNRIYGANLYYDRDRTYRDNRYSQIGFGIETLGQTWDFRANGYVPTGDKTTNTGPVGLDDTPFFFDNRIGFVGYERFEQALAGADFEFGIPLLPNTSWLRGFAGGYAYNQDLGDDPIGVRSRVEGWVSDDLSVGFQYTWDPQFESQFNAMIDWRFAGFKPTRYFPNFSVRERMMMPVQRSWRITVGEYVDTTAVLAVNPRDDVPYFVVWVDNSNPDAGDGTFENPFSTLPAGVDAETDMVLVRRGNTSQAAPLDGSIVLPDYARMLGEGKAHVFDAYANFGNFNVALDNAVLPDPAFTNSGAYPFLTSTAGDIITLGDHNEVSGFVLQDAVGAGIRGAGTNGFHLNNLEITGNAGGGIVLTDATSIAPTLGQAPTPPTVTADGQIINGGLIANINNNTVPGYVPLVPGGGNNTAGGILIDSGAAGLDVALVNVSMNADPGSQQYGIRIVADDGNVTSYLENIDTSGGNVVAGLSLESTGRVMLSEVVDLTSSNNDNAGVVVLGDGLGTEMSVVFDTATINGNGTNGLQITSLNGAEIGDPTTATLDGVSIVDSTINGNTQDGINVQVDGVDSVAELYVATSDVQSNGRHGLNFAVTNEGSFAGFLDTSDLSNNGQTVPGNNINGTVDGVNSVAALFLDGVTADGASDTGMSIVATSEGYAFIDAFESSFNNAGEDGISLLANNSRIDIQAETISANASGQGGGVTNNFVAQALAGGNINASLYDSEFDNSVLGRGISFLADGADSLIITNVELSSASGNGQEGLFANVTAGAELDLRGIDSVFNGNGTSGVYDGVSVLADGADTVALVGFFGDPTALTPTMQASGNTGSGFNFAATNDSYMTARMDTFAANNNDRYGVEFDANGATVAALIVEGDNTLSGNGLGSYLVNNTNVQNAIVTLNGSYNNNAGGSGVEINITGTTDNALVNITGNGVDDTIDNNAGHGIDIRIDGAAQAGVVVSGYSSISNNLLDGVHIELANISDAAAIDIIGPTDMVNNGDDAVGIELDTVTLAPVTFATLPATLDVIDRDESIVGLLDGRLPLPVTLGVGNFAVAPTSSGVLVEGLVIDQTLLAPADPTRNGVEITGNVVTGATGNIVVTGNEITNMSGDGVNVNLTASNFNGLGIIDNASVNFNEGNGVNIVTTGTTLALIENSGNNVLSNGLNGMSLDATDSTFTDVVFDTNTIADSQGGDGIIVDLANTDITNVLQFSDNLIGSAGVNGINLQAGLASSIANLTVSGNTIGGSGTGSGGGTAIDDSLPVIRTGYNSSNLPANDDGSTLAPVALGFDVNFFGVTYSDAYVNNNGNITFNAPLPDYTPFSLLSTATPIIAPFFADVDTRGGSNLTRYGTGTIAGRDAFGVTWDGVRFYDATDPANATTTNEFQLILIDRSDIAAGDFDFEFNYEQVLWETGTASGGDVNGLGGNSARAGYSNGVSTAYEMNGSDVNGAFLDGGPASTSLVQNSQNSSQPGRYVFFARNGVIGAVTGNTGDGFNMDLSGGSTVGNTVFASNSISNNGVHGVDLNVANGNLGPVTMTDNVISDQLSGSGINIVQPNLTGGQLTLNLARNSVDNNAGHGLNIDVPNPAQLNTVVNLTMNNDSFSGNTLDGVHLDLTGSNNGLANNVTANVIIASDATTPNANNGLTNSRFDSNGGNGFNLIADGTSSYNVLVGSIPLGGVTPVTTFSGNTGYGFVATLADNAGTTTGNILMQNVAMNTNETGGVLLFLEDNAETVASFTNIDAADNVGGAGIALVTDDNAQSSLTVNRSIPTGLNNLSGNADAAVLVNLQGSSDAIVNVSRSNLNGTVDGPSGDFGGDGFSAIVRGNSTLTGSLVASTVNSNARDGVRMDVRGDNAGVFGEINNFVIGGLTAAEGNSISGNTGNGISILRTADGEVNNMSILNNTVDGNTVNGLSILAANANKLDTYTINNNSFSDNGLNGIFFDERADADISADMDSNIISNNSNNGIQLVEQVNAAADSRSLTGTWTRNLISENGNNGVLLGGVTNGLLIGDLTDLSLGNEIIDNAASGIHVNGAGTMTIGSNVIARNGTLADLGTANEDAGILMNVAPSSSITVVNNDILLNNGDGVQYGIASNFVDGNGTIRIIDNFIGNNAGRGIDLINRASNFTDAVITGNIVNTNGLEAIYVVNTASATQNQFASSTTDLAADGSVFNDPRLRLLVNDNEVRGNGLNSPANTTGLYLRVGTSDGGGSTDDNGGFASNGGFTTDPFAVLHTRGGVIASVYDNEFGGNFGNDIRFASFVSTVDPVTSAGTWGNTPDPTVVTAYQSDPLARLDLYFDNNIRESADVNNTSGIATADPTNVAFYDNSEGTFKSRLTTTSPPSQGPFTSATRRRNATRQAGFFPPPGNTPAGSSYLYPGVGASTFRVNTTDGAFFIDDTFPYGGTIWGGAITGESAYSWGTLP